MIMAILGLVVIAFVGTVVWGVIAGMIEGYRAGKQELELLESVKAGEHLSENKELLDEQTLEDMKPGNNHTDAYNAGYLAEESKGHNYEDFYDSESHEDFKKRILKEMETLGEEDGDTEQDSEKISIDEPDKGDGETYVPETPDETGYQEFYLSTERTGLLFETDYTVVDIETTGFEYLKDKIVEISAVRVRNHEIVDHFQGFNKKSRLSKFLKENSPITMEDIKGGLPIEELLKNFLDFLGKDTMVGHKIGFDLTFLRYNLHYYGFGDLTNEFIDTMLMGKYYANPDWSHHRVDDYIVNYPKEVGFDNLPQHSAYNDVLIEQRIYEVERGILGDDFSHKASSDMLWALPKVRVVETVEEIAIRTTAKKMVDAIRVAIDDKDYIRSNQLIEELFEAGVLDHNKLYRRMAMNYKQLGEDNKELSTIIKWQSNMGGNIGKGDTTWIQKQLERIDKANKISV